MPKKGKKGVKKSKKTEQQQPALARPQPPRFMRSKTNVTRMNRGGKFNYDQQMLLQSVVNSVNSLPHYLQQHVDERFARLAHEEWKRDEARRNVAVPVEQDTPPPTPRDYSMASSSVRTTPTTTPSPSQPGTPMSTSSSSQQQQQPPQPMPEDVPVVRDPLRHRAMRPIRYTPPTRLSIRTHAFIPVPVPMEQQPTPTPRATTSSPLEPERVERRRAAMETAISRMRPNLSNENIAMHQTSLAEFQEATRLGRMPRKTRQLLLTQ